MRGRSHRHPCTLPVLCVSEHGFGNLLDCLKSNAPSPWPSPSTPGGADKGTHSGPISHEVPGAGQTDGHHAILTQGGSCSRRGECLQSTVDRAPAG